MKVSLNWLRDYVDINMPLTELADRLTMAGLEVEGKKVIGGAWENILVGKIIDVIPHPNADRLRLATVELGTQQPTVVCGAPNLNPGDKIAFAHVGVQLIDGYSGERAQLKSAKIRGVVSNGMICSEKELGISDSHEGIMVLPAEAPVGTSLADYLGDIIFDLEITPNRPDCLSVIGIAREIAALSGQGVRLPELEYEERASQIGQYVSVEIVVPELCPRYCASLINGVKITESPKWMQQRLLTCGMRPINNIVDITNYVMLEYGQPLHAFDYERIRGKKIIVRRAAAGEVIISLDGVERALSWDTLVIADAERAVAVAGVMGGANSEVTEGTTSILLEAANFNPTSIHYTGRSLPMPSEACMRFERGIRPEMAMLGLKRATQLILQLAGGEAAQGVADVYPGKTGREPIRLSIDDVKRVLGVEFSLEQVVSTLTALGFDCEVDTPASVVRATPPYWRSHTSLMVDLVEEVARIIGYDKIPTTMLSAPVPTQNPAPIIGLKPRVRQGLIGYGFQEILTYSLVALESLSKLNPQIKPPEPEPLRLTNPMTADQEYLRPNLRVGLLTALSANRRSEGSGMRLFELGKVYVPRQKDLPDEPERLCGVMAGARCDRFWHGESGAIDFFDAKGVVEGLLGQLGIKASFETGSDDSLHPGRQAAIVIAGNRLGIVGEVHPKVLGAFDISESVFLFEIDLMALLPFTIDHVMFQPIPRFPAVDRDIALIVDDGVTHRQIGDLIGGFPLVTQVAVFDVYSGKQVPPGKKSLAYRITFQSPTDTLTDEAVNQVQQQILDKLFQELGAALRS